MSDRKKYQTDILVIGGGVAGLGALIGTMQNTDHVTMLEKLPFFGGAATAAYVSTVCGLFFRSQSGLPQYVMHGPVRSFAESLAQASETQPVAFAEGLYFLPYARDHFIALSDRVVSQYADSIFLGASVQDVVIDNGSVIEVHADVSGRQVVIHPRVVVDCSGEAVIGRICGHALIRDKKYQAGAQVFSLGGLVGDDDRTISLQLIKAIREGIASGRLSADCERISLVPGSYRAGRANFKLGIPVEITDDPGNFAIVNMTARMLVHEAVRYLRKSTQIFREAEITMLAPAAGIRTGLRYQGAGTLSDEDVLNCIKSDEGIARGAWPIEVWKVGEQPYMGYFRENDYYDIPAPCLESSEINNLWFAGRHLSGSEKAIGSARVIATAMATGYAAGVLASGSMRGIGRSHIIGLIRSHMDLQMEFDWS